MLDAVLLAPLNHVLAGNDWALERLRPYAGRLVRFDIAPLQLTLRLDEAGFFAVSPASDTFDVVITLPANTPLLLLQGIEAVMAAAHVEGNAEFATTLSFVLRSLRWDAEEDLSRLIGDIPARRVVQAGEALFAGQKQAAANLKANVAEFLAHENSLLLTRPDFDVWRTQLVTFAAALDIAERRLAAITP